MAHHLLRLHSPLKSSVICAHHIYPFLAERPSEPEGGIHLGCLKAAGEDGEGVSIVNCPDTMSRARQAVLQEPEARAATVARNAE